MSNTLETKMLAMQNWTKEDTVLCWTSFHTLYSSPKHHQQASFIAQIDGNVNKYIDDECATFARYAKMWRYQKDKTGTQFEMYQIMAHGSVAPAYSPASWTAGDEQTLPDYHHISQENKLTRLYRGAEHYP